MARRNRYAGATKTVVATRRFRLTDDGPRYEVGDRVPSLTSDQADYLAARGCIEVEVEVELDEDDTAAADEEIRRTYDDPVGESEVEETQNDG